MQKKNTSHLILPVLTLLAIGILWEFIVRVFSIPLYILPPPSKVIAAFIENFDILVKHSLVSLSEAGAGICLAVVFGLFVALLMDLFPKFGAAIYPILVITQTIPTIVLAPLFMIYLGFGPAPKVVIVVLMCFFPIVVGVTGAFRDADPAYIRMLTLMGAKNWQIYWHLKIPFAMPQFFDSLYIAATYSIMGAVVGEWLGGEGGLGFYMLRVKNGFMLDKVFAVVLMIVLLSLGMNGLVKLLAFLCSPMKKRKILNDEKGLPE